MACRVVPARCGRSTTRSPSATGSLGADELIDYQSTDFAEVVRDVDIVLALGGDGAVNTDGGLLSRGHPLGATGIAQLIELARQLRGETRSAATDVAQAKVGLAVSGGGWMGADYAACFATLLVSD